MTERRTLREFLLGGLAPEDADAFEERVFEDDALYQDLYEEREALIEEYLAGSLSDEDAARFERRRSLSPELTLEVAELRDLKTLLERRRGARDGGVMETRSFWRPLPVGIAACVFGLVLLLCFQWRENRRLAAELAQKVEEPAAMRATPMQSGQNEAVVFLAAGVTRGPQNTAHVEITPGTSFVQLQIELPENEASAKSWAVEVDRDGRESFRWDAVIARRVGSISYLPVYVATESLPEGSYSVRIRSTDLGQIDESRTFKIGHALISTKH